MMKQNWIYKRFDEVFDLQMGKTPDRQNPSYFQGENVWISIRDLGEKYISDSKEKISDKALVDTGIRIVKKGTVIMSFKLTVGKCGIAAKDLYTNEAIMAFNLKDGIQLESSFLYYYLQGYHWQGANKAVMGITLNKATISRHIVGIPPLPLQQSIVAELDNINNLINIKKAQLKDLDNLAQSIFYEMFGDPIENEKGWDVKKLGEIAKDKLSYGSGTSAIPYDGLTRYVRITDIKDNGELNIEKVSPNVVDEKYLLNEGDILFARSGATVGKTYLYKGKDGKCLYAGYLIKLVPNTEIVLPVFVFHYTKTPYYLSFISKVQRAVAQPNINAKQYGDLLIPLPPLPLQQKFAEKIEAIEKHKQIVNVTIKDLETLLASRMQFWFE